MPSEISDTYTLDWHREEDCVPPPPPWKCTGPHIVVPEEFVAQWRHEYAVRRLEEAQAEAKPNAE